VRNQWLLPVILAILKAEIERILVPGQPGPKKKKKKKLVRPHLSGKKLGVVVYLCHPSDGGRHKIVRSQPKLTGRKSKNLCSE
jgi:hypothetical protein